MMYFKAKRLEILVVLYAVVVAVNESFQELVLSSQLTYFKEVMTVSMGFRH
jgi:hypothetical protein